MSYSSGGPKNIKMLYSLNQLQEDFCELRIKTNKKLLLNLNEGQGHQGKASIIEFEAFK